MAHLHFARDDIQADAADARGRAGQIFFDDGRMQADGLKNLRAAIALDGRNAHLGNHLDHALDGGLDEIVAGVVMRDFDAATPGGSCRRAFQRRDRD